MSINIPMNECFVVGFGIPPVPGNEIHTPVDLINVKLCIYIAYVFALYLKQKA
jgi:hypothetical protein